MKIKAITHFLIGIVISFTIEIVVMTIAVLIAGGVAIPVSMIWQAFALAISCSIVGTIFSSDKLSFLLQAIFTYVFSLTTVLLFSFLFHWESMSDGIFTGISYFVIIIGLFTTGYSVTMLLTFILQNKKKKIMNEKLAEFKEKSKSIPER
jgi:hypothetical protein